MDDYEWADTLRAMYPELFRGCHPANVEVPTGWRKIVGSAMSVFDLMRVKCDAEVTIAQIKEKFGGLRIYWSGDTDISAVREVLDAAVMVAESRAWKTCEVCGETGKTRGDGWIRTLCDGHAEAGK